MDPNRLAEAIYAAAFVDAMRNIYDRVAMGERVRQSDREATLVVEAWRRHRVR